MARLSKHPANARCTWLVVADGNQPVYVTGNTPELGEWNPEHALKLHCCRPGTHGRHWDIDLSLPRGHDVEFKFLRKTGEGNVIWEAGENRRYHVGDGEAAVEWGAFRVT